MKSFEASAMGMRNAVYDLAGIGEKKDEHERVGFAGSGDFEMVTVLESGKVSESARTLSIDDGNGTRQTFRKSRPSLKGNGVYRSSKTSMRCEERKAQCAGSDSSILELSKIYERVGMEILSKLPTEE